MNTTFLLLTSGLALVAPVAMAGAANDVLLSVEYLASFDNQPNAAAGFTNTSRFQIIANDYGKLYHQETQDDASGMTRYMGLGYTNEQNQVLKYNYEALNLYLGAERKLPHDTARFKAWARLSPQAKKGIDAGLQADFKVSQNITFSAVAHHTKRDNFNEKICFVSCNNTTDKMSDNVTTVGARVAISL